MVVGHSGVLPTYVLEADCQLCGEEVKNGFSEEERPNSKCDVQW